MIKKTVLLISGILIVSVVAQSQITDFGIWYSVSAEKDLSKKLELDADLNLRTINNASKIEETFLDLGLTYKFNKFLSVAAGYRFTEFMEDDDAFHPRHKWFADLKGKITFGDFDVSARMRYQQRYKTYIEDDNDKESKKVGRTRIKILYDIPSFPLNPYASAEIFYPLFIETSRTIEQHRYTVGFEYNFSKKHSVEAEYLFQRDNYPKPLEMNIISFNYQFKF
jgi:predicted porin